MGLRRRIGWVVVALALALAGAACGDDDHAHDSGTDAGGSDAGPGEMDAAPPDAGPSDAGGPDAAEPDAGPPDAGASDAGPPDSGSACGDGLIQGAEECDGDDLGSETCVSRGHAGGTLDCDPVACTIIETDCVDAK